jgi:flavin reductase (DIM6/NTAB) family NADH-FMN oxidoreductase RutF
VTVVTAMGRNGPSGLTANSVTSLSLEPPMMLACLDRDSRTLVSVQSSGRFGINVLSAGDEALARSFGSKDAEPDKWEGVDWSERQAIPLIESAVVWIGCRLNELVEGGDHVIATASVLDLDVRGGQPLIFHGGGYRGLD